MISTKIGKFTNITGLDIRFGRDVIVFNSKGETVLQATFSELSDEVKKKLGIDMAANSTPRGKVRGILVSFNKSTDNLLSLANMIFSYTTEGQEVESQRTRGQNRRERIVHEPPKRTTEKKPTAWERFLGAPSPNKRAKTTL